MDRSCAVTAVTFVVVASNIALCDEVVTLCDGVVVSCVSWQKESSLVDNFLIMRPCLAVG